LLFGLSDPKFWVDIAHFFGGPSCSYFNFNSDEQLRKQLDLALEVIEQVFPIFEKSVISAIE